jgi:CHAT domain-containing protein
MQDIHILGAALYGDLTTPFADQVNHADSVELDLDDSLAPIPFAALSAGSTPFGVQHPLIFLPDGWSLDADARNSLLADQDTLSDKFRMLVLRQVSAPGAAHIPGEYDESKAIARQFPGAKLETAVLWRSGPNLNIAGAPVLQSDVATADVLHYTGHGLEETKATPPLGLSSFVVADGSTLRCRLAVLAACRTLDQRENLAEDVPSFARILLQAGAKNVLATQWDVDSRMTQKLMLRFYTELTNHQTFAEALRRAQLSIQSDPSASHPYFWSAFQLVGRPTTSVRGKS